MIYCCTNESLRIDWREFFSHSEAEDATLLAQGKDGNEAVRKQTVNAVQGFAGGAIVNQLKTINER